MAISQALPAAVLDQRFSTISILPKPSTSPKSVPGIGTGYFKGHELVSDQHGGN